MWVDENNNCWLNEDYSVYEDMGGTVDTIVKKLEHGYSVNIAKSSEKKWKTSSEPCYGTQKKSCYGKVIELITK